MSASVLARYPSFDRSTVAFPTVLIDFFFDLDDKEHVLTKKEKEAEALKMTPNEENSFQQAVCTTADGNIIYITAHLFYEDLAKI